MRRATCQRQCRDAGQTREVGRETHGHAPLHRLSWKRPQRNFRSSSRGRGRLSSTREGGWSRLRSGHRFRHRSAHRRPCRQTTANVLHLFVSDAAALAARCAAAGARIAKDLKPQEYGQRAFVVADPDGNRLHSGERLR
ncbi:VOC family protein [Sphingomonas beigongshangi]|uniref:VOC family protein n=1 Tax=Sphingomonas beigongshangi TaxID=2782540 RepID=UPI0030B86108